MTSTMKNSDLNKNYMFSNKDLVRLIIPLIIEQLLAVLVGIADSIMIANVGESAVSGVSLVDGVMLLFITIFSAMGAGGAVVAGQYLGYKNTKEAGRASTQMVWLLLLISLGTTAVIYVGKDLILDYVFGSISAEVRRHANTYLMIVTASIPFIAVYNGGAAIFRAMGNSKITMKVSMIMNAVNVGGNALLIYGFHCEAEGVAIPTLASRMVAAILIMAFLYKDKGPIQMESLLKVKPEGRMIKRILSLGIPNGMENGMFQLGKLLVLSLVATFGTSAIAANAVSNMIAWFESLPGMAINLAITTVIAQCIGAGDIEQAKYYLKKLLKLEYICMLAANIVIVVGLPLILYVYNLTPETAETVRQLIYLHTVFCITVWPISFSVPAALRAAGDAKVTMWISTISMWICRIGFSFILGKFLGWGVFGVWSAMILDWFARSVFMVARYRQGKWKDMRAI